MKRWIELALVALLILAWLDWRILRNWFVALVAIVHFPAYLIESGNWRVFVPVLLFAAVIVLTGLLLDAVKGTKRR
jgi:hypothetical protein